MKAAFVGPALLCLVLSTVACGDSGDASGTSSGGTSSVGGSASGGSNAGGTAGSGAAGGGGSGGTSASGGSSGAGGQGLGGQAGSGGVAGAGGSAGSVGCSASLQTDAKNCGFCGHDCGGATCSAGLCAPQTLTTVSGGALELVVHQSRLYILTKSGLDVVDLDGKNAAHLLTPDAGTELADVRDDGTGLLLAVDNQPFGPGGGVLRLNTQTNASTWPASSALGSVAVEADATHFFLTQGPDLWRVSRDGTSSNELPEDWVYRQSLYLDGSYLYYISMDSKAVMKLDKAGAGPPQKLKDLNIVSGAMSLVAGVDSVFVSVFDYPTPGELHRVPKNGSSPTKLASGEVLWASAADGSDVFFSVGVMAPQLVAQSLTTGQQRTYAQGQKKGGINWQYRATVSGDWVYYSEYDTVKRVRR